MSEKGQADLKELEDFRGGHVVVADLFDHKPQPKIEFSSIQQRDAYIERIYYSCNVPRNGCSLINRKTGVACGHRVSDFKSFVLHAYSAHAR